MPTHYICIFSFIFVAMTKNTKTHLIPLKKVYLDSDGIHILIPSNIGIDSYFILDTGASKSVIDSAILEHVEYEKIEVELIESSHIQGMIDGEFVQIEKIQFGDFICNDFQAISMSLSHVNSIYSRFIETPIAGLLGGDFFDKYKAVISYADMSLCIQNIE